MRPPAISRFVVLLAVLVLGGSGAGIAAEPADEPAHPVGELVPPQVIAKSYSPPVYPPAAKAGRFSGLVVVEATIGTDGRVRTARVAECSHIHLGFEDAALTAVRNWRFHPATHNGDPVPWESRFRLHFGRTGARIETAMALGPASAHGSGPESTTRGPGEESARPRTHSSGAVGTPQRR